MKMLIVFAVLLSSISLSAFAGRYHTPMLTTWSLELNNGVAYINSPQMPSHCSYSRAQISMSGTEFDKSQFAFALAAFKSKTQVVVVVDDTQTTCVVSGMRDLN